MSKRNKKQSEPSVRVAPIVSTKPDSNPTPTEIPVEQFEPLKSLPTLESLLFMIKVDGLWMSSFAPLKTTEKKSEAVALDHDSATVFARHIEFRKKGICEIIPV